MNRLDDTRAVEIFHGSIFEAEMLKSILADNQVDAYLQDEYIGTIAPWNASPGGVAPVRVVVSSNDLERVRPIVADFINRPDDQLE